MVYKCKICAGSVSILPQSRIAVCDYCGTKQVLPRFTDDSAKILFERGNQYLANNEYDKAESVFTQLLTINPNDGEMYWDLVLCKYGVTYAKDPKTGKYIPTCNRTSIDSVFSDSNYIKAVEMSEPENVEVYKNDAALIDQIQKGILSISKKEKPFDIFISYKETDNNGYRTKDSVEAQNLYNKLTELGYKVFFSRITLESKIGEEYEPYIYAALSSSKVMITICSSQEYIESAWVKNEWSRFLTLRRTDSNKTLIPLYFDMNKEELPAEFGILPTQNMKDEGFEQELIRGIQKIIPVPVAKKEKRGKTIGFASIALAIVIVVSGVVIFNLLHKKNEIENQMIIASENSAEIVEQYNRAMSLFDSGKYEEAKELFVALGEYSDSSIMAETCDKEKEYTNAVSLFDKKAYDDASSIFEKLDGYKDSEEMAYKCKYQGRYDEALALFEDARYDDASLIFQELGDYEDSENMAYRCLYQEDYNKAMSLYYDRSYPQATWAFAKISEFEDSSNWMEKCEKNWRDSLSAVAIKNRIAITSSYGSYYVTANGTVDTFDFDRGSANEEYEVGSSGEVISSHKFELNEHGKVVSLASMYKLYALYEDGYLANSAVNNNSDNDWVDVIQMTDFFDATNIALLADGSIKIGDAYNSRESWMADEWLLKTEEWTDIIQLDWTYSRIGSGNIQDVMVVGVDSEEHVHTAFHVGEHLFDSPGDMFYDAAKYIEKLENIKSIKIQLTNNGKVDDYKEGFFVAALDSNDIFHVFEDKNEYTIDVGKVIDFEVTDKGKIVYINEKNQMKEAGNDKVILENVIYMEAGYCITNSGSLYSIDGTNTGAQTSVRDVWLERR